VPHFATDLRNALTNAAFDITTILPWSAALATAPSLQNLAAPTTTHALIIGNSRQLWPRFVDAYRCSNQLRCEPHPLDHWIEQQLSTILVDRPHRFGHRAYDDKYVPLQRLAVAAGLGRLSETHLVIHPVFGPWFSLRAVVAIDAPTAAEFVATAAPITAGNCDPLHCMQQCQQRFAEAQAAPPGSWRAWLAARAACSVGRDWRFSDAQIAYHYCKDTTALVGPQP
jgi:cyanocobalamin reductase (cyanide-eliminating) / alkylcobalamin dealkylase